MWDMLQTTSSHGWAVGDKTNSMRFATSLEEVRGLGTGRPARHGGGSGGGALPRPGEPQGARRRVRGGAGAGEGARQVSQCGAAESLTRLAGWGS